MSWAKTSGYCCRFRVLGEFLATGVFNVVSCGKAGRETGMRGKIVRILRDSLELQNVCNCAGLLAYGDTML